MDNNESVKAKEIMLPPFDVAGALDIVNNNSELYKRLINYFLTSYSEAESNVYMLLKDKDCSGVISSIHKIKGSSGNLGLNAVYDLICDIEGKCKSNNIDAIYDKLDVLKSEMNKISAFFSLENWKDYI